ncbi:alpha/beta hydrolase [Saccharothrix syringae]|uniref:Alpha/beta hydrolase n=1 Tax=Saccharothrix syringae TaxID=103733 RepID=A0A5Q0GVB6_SACSY|nr:alpha/beta hydrolase [Saccharothrix syringae]QFZ17861.1 alpha/beta hydrolase [Saccharothrix syringae]
MAVNEQVRAVLEKMAGGPRVEESTPFAARQAALGYLQFQGEPEPARVEHLFVPGPTADLPARVYYPAEGGGPFPGIVFLHGSGWVTCNLDVYDVALRALANATGHAVFAVNYQKAPEHPFPVPLDDSYAATGWFFAHAGALGVRPDRIGVMGDSAGGNLAAAVAAKARDGGPALAFQVLVVPALDRDFTTESHVDSGEGFGLDTAAMRWFWAQYLGDREPSELAAPLRARSFAGLPPTFVATAEHDPVRSDGERYAEALAAAGVPVRHLRMPGTVHAFTLLDGVLDDYRALLREVSAWLGRTASVPRSARPVPLTSTPV